MPRRPPVHAPLPVTTCPRPPFATSIVPDTRTPKQGAIHRTRPTTPLPHYTQQQLYTRLPRKNYSTTTNTTVLLQLAVILLHRTSTPGATTHQEKDNGKLQQQGQQGERQRGRRYPFRFLLSSLVVCTRYHRTARYTRQMLLLGIPAATTAITAGYNRRCYSKRD